MSIFSFLQMLRDLSEFLVLNDDEENDDDYTAPFAAKTLQHLSEYVPVRMVSAVSYTHLRAHETGRNLVCRLLLEKKKEKNKFGRERVLAKRVGAATRFKMRKKVKLLICSENTVFFFHPADPRGIT